MRCAYLVTLLLLTSARGASRLPTINDTLCYGMSLEDATGEHNIMHLVINGREESWLEECFHATRQLHQDIASFICSHVSFGVMRKHRRIQHKFILNNDMLYPVLQPADMKRLNDTGSRMVNIYEGDDLGHLFTDVDGYCYSPIKYEKILCTISRVAFVDKDKDNRTLGAKVGLASSIYWRQFAYSLPYRIKHNITTTYYSGVNDMNNGDEVEVCGKFGYGIDEALKSSVATIMQNVENDYYFRDSVHVSHAGLSTNDRKSYQEVTYLTVAITTCKRLHFFLRTFSALQQILQLNSKEQISMENDNVYSIIGYKINEILIVDDSSNFNDRQEMLLHTKNCKYCNFIFKGSLEKGHQKSMNIIYRMTSNRYLLYVEDDWLPLMKPFVPQSFLHSMQTMRGVNNNKDNSTRNLSISEFLSVAISILRKHHQSECQDFPCLEDRSIVQVLLNDQSIRLCAVFYDQPQLCKSLAQNNLLGVGGWPRYLELRHVNVTGLEERMTDAVRIPYSVHEYGLSRIPSAECPYFYGDKKLNEVSIWPGFSLNPGITDVYRIKSLLQSDLIDRSGEKSMFSADDHSLYGLFHKRLNSWFDEQDPMFEHSFSSNVHARGGRMAFLPLLVFEHSAGQHESAYLMQGTQRYWDDVARV